MARKFFLSLFIVAGLTVANAGVIKTSAHVVKKVLVKPTGKVVKVAKKVVW